MWSTNWPAGWLPKKSRGLIGRQGSRQRGVASKCLGIRVSKVPGLAVNSADASLNSGSALTKDSNCKWGAEEGWAC